VSSKEIVENQLIHEASFKSVSKPIEINEKKTSPKFFWKDTIEIQAKNY